MKEYLNKNYREKITLDGRVSHFIINKYYLTKTFKEQYGIEDAFYLDLTFGTGGLRGTIGAGTNRMNVYVVAKASQGLFKYLLKHFSVPTVVIGYDSRIKSDVFARTAAGSLQRTGLLSVSGRSCFLFRQ